MKDRSNFVLQKPKKVVTDMPVPKDEEQGIMISFLQPREFEYKKTRFLPTHLFWNLSVAYLMKLTGAMKNWCYKQHMNVKIRLSTMSNTWYH